MTQRIGLNMYSLRDFGTTASDLTETFKRLVDIGYRYVQISGLSKVTPAEITDALTRTGLKACATHIGWDQFMENTDAVINLHKQYGTNHSAIGSLPPEYRSSEGASRFIAEAENVIPQLTAAGLDFSYHNHNHEYVRFGDTTWIDMIHDAGAPLGLKFEIDTYWVVAGGADPAEYITRFSEAMSIVHVKDMVVTEEREQRFAPVGSGNLNWPRVFGAIRSAPIEYVIVEQDNHYTDDAFENVAASFRFLADNGFSPE